MTDERVHEFMDKMIEAKKMEMDALMSLLPETTKEHMHVIRREVMEMLAECLMEASKEDEKPAAGKKKAGKKVKSGVSKVDIE